MPLIRSGWMAVHPTTREVFVTLTNNKHRGKSQPTLPTPGKITVTGR
ncbi:hypothetical protein [Parendozoicomonas sp. Alg238-R29]|nr:hypothetical protein [Parendozoicomonas sp. Alg238-R29]